MNIKEIVVISGKGGTGKTTLVASLVPFIEDLVIADCDVDAPDLNILFGNTIKSSEDFVGLKRAVIDEDKCIKCGLCHTKCKFSAITEDIKVNFSKCEGCGVCEYICPVNAIEMKDSIVGQIFTSDTKYGEMVHARLIPGEETSGKLVAQVRKKAKMIAENNGMKNIIIDGSPGIACNVIASITGASKVIIVIEPTLSGLHDLEKVHKLVKKFNLTVEVVINKCDLSKEGLEALEKYCDNENLNISLKIPFNRKMVESISNKEIPSIYDKKFFESIGFKEFLENL
jgi:MinD superfamily P-loop ATPase